MRQYRLIPLHYRPWAELRRLADWVIVLRTDQLPIGDGGISDSSPFTQGEIEALSRRAFDLVRQHAERVSGSRGAGGAADRALAPPPPAAPKKLYVPVTRKVSAKNGKNHPKSESRHG